MLDFYFLEISLKIVFFNFAENQGQDITYKREGRACPRDKS